MLRRYTKEIICIGSAGMAILGFTRGIHSYDYNHRNGWNKFEPYMYSTRIGFGVVGMFMYLCPAFYFVVIPKEIYRLEVNVRGLEDEKETRFYNNIL